MIDRKLAPKVKITKKIAYLNPKKYTTLAGIPIYYMDNPSSEAARIELLFNAGTVYQGPVIAAATSALLLGGTDALDLAEINDNIDDFGGFFDTNLNADYAVLSIFGLNEVMFDLTKFIENSIRCASFPQKEIDHFIQNSKEKFKVNLEKVNFLCQRAFQEHLFYGTPYSKTTSLAAYDKLSQLDIRKFHNEYFLNGLRRITIIGNFSEKELEDISSLFNDWKHTVQDLKNIEPEVIKNPIHISKANALQVGIRIGKMLVDRTHPDYHKMTVVNTIFGDYFGSRLMSNIREDKGYTYGIGSFIAENKLGGYFGIGTEVAKEFLEDTLVQIQLELTRLQTTCVEEDELDLVKNYLLGQILKSADGPFAMMELFSAVEIRGLDYSFFNEALAVIINITPEEILETAKRQLNWDEMLLVTAG